MNEADIVMQSVMLDKTRVYVDFLVIHEVGALKHVYKFWLGEI